MQSLHLALSAQHHCLKAKEHIMHLNLACLHPWIPYLTFTGRCVTSRRNWLVTRHSNLGWCTLFPRKLDVFQSPYEQSSDWRRRTNVEGSWHPNVLQGGPQTIYVGCGSWSDLSSRSNVYHRGRCNVKQQLPNHGTGQREALVWMTWKWRLQHAWRRGFDPGSPFHWLCSGINQATLEIWSWG